MNVRFPGIWDGIVMRKPVDIYEQWSAAASLARASAARLSRQARLVPWPWPDEQWPGTWLELLVSGLGYDSGWDLERTRTEAKLYVEGRTSDELLALIAAHVLTMPEAFRP